MIAKTSWLGHPFTHKYFRRNFAAAEFHVAVATTGASPVQRAIARQLGVYQNDIMRPGRGATSTTQSPYACSHRSSRSQVSVEMFCGPPTGAHNIVLINPELPRYRSLHGASICRGYRHVEFDSCKFPSQKFCTIKTILQPEWV